MNKQKNIQIPEETFWDALKICYIVLDEELRSYLEPNELEVVERFQKALDFKLNQRILHDVYSRSKDKNLTEEKREQARQDYLDRKGIHKSFRY